MRLVFISDTHTHMSFTVPPGDVLIHAGDATSTGTPDEVGCFLEWFAAQPHEHKILIAGNHDWLYQTRPDLAHMMLAEYPGVTYLEDSGVVIAGVRFWGSPWQPCFNDWAFNLPPGGPGIRRVWNLIPMDTDVLVTHGPPQGVLDAISDGLPPLGCRELKIRLAAVKPRIHAFGHIHGGYGAALSDSTLYVNASTCNENYFSVNRPIVVDLTDHKVKVLGIDPTPRKGNLDRIKAILEAGSGQPAACVAAQEQAALQAMADLRAMTLPALIQDYGHRGLHATVKKMERDEQTQRNRSLKRGRATTPPQVAYADASPRRERLDAIRATLDAASGNPAEIRILRERTTLPILAELRGMTLAVLLQEFAHLGLRADLNQMEKAEAKPGNRPIPLRFIKE